MAITYDTDAYGVSDAATTTVGITVANNTNRILVALIGLGNSTGASQISSVVFNGSESFTAIGTISDNGEDEACDIWYLVNPTATTANVVVTYDGTPDASVNVVSLYGVDQSDPIGTIAQSNALDGEGSTDWTTNITTDTANSWLLDVVNFGYYNDTGIPDAGQTELRDAEGGSGAGLYRHYSSYRSCTTAQQYGMGWLTSGDPDTDARSQLIVEIHDADGGGGTVIKDIIGNGFIPAPR